MPGRMARSAGEVLGMRMRLHADGAAFAMVGLPGLHRTSGAGRMKTTPKARQYPMVCRSMYCGKIEPSCRTCRHVAEKDTFTAWRLETDAYEPDPVWSPGSFVARRIPDATESGNLSRS